ncbi:iron chelate uptake ABC transporter family permease subunit [Streptomyces oceani]|uniref:iron chelate uptake ABC transporter family permease subunit n=1 Tax=Streptomyces oceani TaxID=1075402 RepID=UPI00147A8B58|nr:iron chelate uptake ABC transporter family permease subunit [Streptomyces oceani]
MNSRGRTAALRHRRGHGAGSGQVLDVLALGERQAHHVGLHVKRTRVLLIFATALVVGAAVALAGSIGFVGLVVPHMVRLLVGPVLDRAGARRYRHLENVHDLRTLVAPGSRSGPPSMA